jgi:uncharacterized membrane protein YczE
MALIVTSDLGAASWDVCHPGVSDRTGMPVGTVTIPTGVALGGTRAHPASTSWRRRDPQ